MAPDTGAHSRLLRHDWTVARNALFRAPSTWRERVRWLVGVPLLVAALHFWLTGLPDEIAARTVAGSSFFLAATITRFAGRRLEFHRSDGVRAADALRAANAWRYFAVVVGLGVATAAAVAALLDPHVVAVCLAAMGAGVVAGSLLNFAMRFAAPRQALAALWRRLSTWLRRPVGGLAMAPAFAVLVLAVAASAPEQVAVGVLSPAALVCSLGLSTVDAQIVRFMAQSGFPVSATILRHARGLAVFAPLAALTAFTGFGAAAIVPVAAAVGIALSIMCLRILTYRLYEKHAADLASSLLTATLAMVAVFVPPAAPVAIGATIWALWRRARPATWLLST